MFKKIKKYLASRRAAKIEKAAKLVKNAKAIREDRWAALEYLSELDDVHGAVTALLQRFEFSLEHGINDTREKELALRGIVRHGDAAIAIIQKQLASTTRIAWPIKALKALGREDVVVESLRGALSFGDVAFDQSAVDKNYDILCYLRDYKLDGFVERLSHFLNDPDERVRFAAVELVIEQTDSAIPKILERFLIDASAENRRLRQAVSRAFVEHKWPVTNPEIIQSGTFFPGVVLGKGNVLEQLQAQI